MDHRARLLPVVLGFIAVLLLPQPSRAEPGLLCRAAIEAAERAFALPPRLLAAIGRVESGRRDAATGDFHPWPWAVNAEGKGSFYPTKEAAIAAVQALQAQGVRSIDVGCMQVNLRHHPTAFASLEEAFDPVANTRYAARFLTELQQARGGDWQRASAAYHSSTPELGEAYRTRVLAALEEERRRPPGTALAAVAPTPQQLPLPGGAGGIGGNFLRSGRTGGGFMLSNGADRVQILAAPPGSTGRGLDAYRSMPTPLSARPPVTPAATQLGTTGAIAGRRLF